MRCRDRFEESKEHIDKMSRRKLSLWISVIAVSCLMVGCTRNPEVRKKRFADKGNSDFQLGKYREAVIEYSNAVQIDPKYADAHYGLAQSFLKQGDFPHAYQELMRTVEYAPTNWKALVPQDFDPAFVLRGRAFRRAVSAVK